LCWCLLKGLDIDNLFHHYMYLALPILFWDNNGTGVIMKCYTSRFCKKADEDERWFHLKTKKQNNRTKAAINTTL